MENEFQSSNEKRIDRREFLTTGTRAAVGSLIAVFSSPLLTYAQKSGSDKALGIPQKTDKILNAMYSNKIPSQPRSNVWFPGVLADEFFIGDTKYQLSATTYFQTRSDSPQHSDLKYELHLSVFPLYDKPETYVDCGS